MLSGGEEAIMITHTLFQCKQERLNSLRAILKNTWYSHFQLFLLGCVWVSSQTVTAPGFYFICNYLIRKCGVVYIKPKISICLINFTSLCDSILRVATYNQGCIYVYSDIEIGVQLETKYCPKCY